jgi:hypothetical protein
MGRLRLVPKERRHKLYPKLRLVCRDPEKVMFFASNRGRTLKPSRCALVPVRIDGRIFLARERDGILMQAVYYGSGA